MKKTIMVMDDDIDIRFTVADILEDQGYTVTTACDGQEGLVALNTMAPNPGLIILDQMMPNMDGSEFLKIRAQSNILSKIPVAYFSADTDILQKSKNAGIEALRKPVDFNELLALVKKYCN